MTAPDPTPTPPNSPCPKGGLPYTTSSILWNEFLIHYTKYNLSSALQMRHFFRLCWIGQATSRIFPYPRCLAASELPPKPDHTSSTRNGVPGDPRDAVRIINHELRSAIPLPASAENLQENFSFRLNKPSVLRQ
jgi:hypothetical protein